MPEAHGVNRCATQNLTADEVRMLLSLLRRARSNFED